MPAVGKILTVFVSILILARIRVPLGAALLIGSAALNLWAGLGAAQTLGNLGQSFISSELWLLLAVTAIIIEFGRYMTEGRNADQIVATARRWGGRHGRSAALMMLPAFIGLVPMPAGALFSAPLVEQAGGPGQGRPEWKSAVNYWFRHIWEYWWPLYPGVIVAMAIFEIDVWRFMAAQFPFMLVAAGAGYVFLIRPHMQEMADLPGQESTDESAAPYVLLPLALVVTTVFVAPPVMARVCPSLGIQSSKLVAVLIGLLIGLVPIVWDEARSPHGLRRMFSNLFKKRGLNVLMTLAGVIIFKSQLKLSGQLPIASSEILESGIPLTVAVAVLPFLAGLVTGLALGFAGVSFPLVVGLMNTEGSGLTPLSTLVLAYGAGYMGMMLSPVHLCLLVTRDYFSSVLLRIYRHILPCIGVVFVYCILAHLALRALGW